jgi:hypothetical protein
MMLEHNLLAHSSTGYSVKIIELPQMNVITIIKCPKLGLFKTF